MHCLSPKGELCVSSAGLDKLRSSARLATARHRLAAPTGYAQHEREFDQNTQSARE